MVKPLDYTDREILNVDYLPTSRGKTEDGAPLMEATVIINFKTAEKLQGGPSISVRVCAEIPEDPRLSELEAALLSEAIAVLRRTGALQLSDLMPPEDEVRTEEVFEAQP